MYLASKASSVLCVNKSEVGKSSGLFRLCLKMWEDLQQDFRMKRAELYITEK